MFLVRFLSTLVLCAACAACAPEGPSAYVTGNIPPEEDDNKCVYPPASDLFLFYGLYDIGGGSRGQCERPYQLHLQVQSNLIANADISVGRAEPNVLQVQRAEVRLTTIQDEVIVFDRFDANVLPNPFLVTANSTLQPTASGDPTPGVVSVEVVPAAYAEQLDRFIDGQILAEVKLFGTTLGDVDVDFKPFIYPIEICEGCLTLCESRIRSGAVDAESVVFCDGGSDGRYCLDDGC